MPQITLEYSSHFEATDWRALALGLHDIAVETVGATLEACKTRLSLSDRLIVADGDPAQAVVQCEIRILSGRTQAQKTALGEQALAAIQARLAAYDGPAQITVEVGDIDRDNYRKATSGAG